MTDFPFSHVQRRAMILSSEGQAFHQRFTCAYCQKRVRVETPNLFVDIAACPFCEHETDLTKVGCNVEVR